MSLVINCDEETKKDIIYAIKHDNKVTLSDIMKDLYIDNKMEIIEKRLEEVF